MIATYKNRIINEAYENILLAEMIRNTEIAKNIIDWKKKYIKTVTDKSKANKTLKEIANLIGNETDNDEIMDLLSSNFIILSKLTDDKEAKNALTEILEKL